MLFKKRREFIVREKDVTTLLSAINNQRTFYDVAVGNCGWGSDLTDRWFVMFYMSDKKYTELMKELTEIGTVTVEVRPNPKIKDLFFEANAL